MILRDEWESTCAGPKPLTCVSSVQLRRVPHLLRWLRVPLTFIVFPLSTPVLRPRLDCQLVILSLPLSAARIQPRFLLSSCRRKPAGAHYDQLWGIVCKCVEVDAWIKRDALQPRRMWFRRMDSLDRETTYSPDAAADAASVAVTPSFQISSLWTGPSHTTRHAKKQHPIYRYLICHMISMSLRKAFRWDLALWIDELGFVWFRSFAFLFFKIYELKSVPIIGSNESGRVS